MGALDFGISQCDAHWETNLWKRMNDHHHRPTKRMYKCNKAKQNTAKKKELKQCPFEKKQLRHDAKENRIWSEYEKVEMLLYHSSDLIWTHCFALAKPSFWISITMPFALSMVLAGCVFFFPFSSAPCRISCCTMSKYLYRLYHCYALLELTSIVRIFFSSLLCTTVHGFKFIVDTKIIYHCFLCWPSTRLGQNEKIFVTNEIHSIQNTEQHSKWFVHYGMMCLCWYKKHFRRRFTTFEIDYMTIAAWLYSFMLYTSTQTK